MDAPSSIVLVWRRMWRVIVDHRGFVTALAIFAVLVLTKFTWGIPLAVSPETLSTWPVDTIAPVAPLTEAFHSFSRDGTDPVVYPLFHYVVLDAFYSPYVALQYLLGGFNSPSSVFPYGVADTQAFFRHLTLIARLVSFGMAAGIMWGIYRISEELASRQVANWSVAFLSLLAPLVYYAKTSNLDVPYLFWSSLAFLQYICAYKYKRISHYIKFAIFASLAVATKDQAFGFFLLLPFVLIYGIYSADEPHRQKSISYVRAIADKRILTMVVVGIGSFVLANNMVLGGLDGFIRHIEFADTFHQQNIKVEYPDLYSVGHQWMVVRDSVTIFVGMLGVGTFSLSLVGIILTIRDRSWVTLSLLLIAMSYYVFVIMVAGVALPRYLLGPVLLLLPFSGIAAHWIFRSLSQRRVALFSGAILVFGWQLLLSVNLNLTLIKDSRYAMEEWIRENIAPGARIESQLQVRYLPRLSDQYEIDVVGNSLDLITYDVIAADLSEEALKRRDPEYILVMKGLGVTGDPEQMEPPERLYFDALLNEELGYRVLAKFSTPSLLPYKQVTAGTRPTSYFLARDR